VCATSVSPAFCESEAHPETSPPLTSKTGRALDHIITCLLEEHETVVVVRVKKGKNETTGTKR